MRGRHSLDLWGPDEGLGAYTGKKRHTSVSKNFPLTDQMMKKLSLTNAPPSLSSIQCLGALSLFKCFFNPLAWNSHKHQS